MKPDRHALSALLVIGAASVLASLDLFVVNLAFTSIRDSFPGATNRSLSWVLSAYSILFAAFLVPAGRLGDRYGRKRVFRLGLLVFAIASAACAVAPTVATLVAARALKGIGAALMIPTSLGLLLATFPEAKHKQMVSIWAATGSVAAALGPVLGGVLVEQSWRLIFLVNLPVAIPALLLSRTLVETPRVGSRVPDLLGSIVLTASVGCLVGVISVSTDADTTRATLVGGALLTCILTAVFVWRCLHAASPALDLSVFRVPSFTLATIGMLAFYIAFAMTLLAGTLLLTQVWRWDATKAGLAFGVGPLMGMIAALVAGRASVSPRTLTIAGGGCIVLAGLFWCAVLGDEPHYLVHFLPGLLLTGAGAGMAQTGFLAGGAAALSPSAYATGTGILNTARQIGAAVGVALLVAVTGTAVGAGSYRNAFLVIAGFGVLTIASAAFLKANRGESRALVERRRAET